MGILIMAQRDDSAKKKFKGTTLYGNKDAVSNVIHYITRTRKDETRQDSLISYGGCGVACYGNPDFMVQQMNYVQNVYDIEHRLGRRLYHEIFLISDEDFMRLKFNCGAVHEFAMRCSAFYFSKGFQVVFAIHWQPDKRLHIHFCVNSVSYIDGEKWHTTKQETKEREKLFNRIFEDVVSYYAGVIIQPLIMMQ